MIRLQFSDGSMLNVEKEEAFQLHLPMDKIETNHVVLLPCTSRRIMSLVIRYCRSPAMDIDAEFFQHDEVTLFNLIQAAHHFKIKNLMDQACQTLVNRVKDNLDQKFDINQTSDQAPKLQNRISGSHILRSHSREAFINKSDEMVLGYFEIDVVSVMKRLLSKTEDATLDNYVTEFLESSNFFETGGFFKNIKDNNELLKSAIPKLSLAVDGIHKVTVRDRELADLLSPKVALRLIRILKIPKCYDMHIKFKACEILSRISFSKCKDEMKEVVPILVEAICSDWRYGARTAALILAHLAFASSNWINSSHFKDLQNAVIKHKQFEAANKIALFLVFVCHGDDLTLSEKVEVVLPVLEHIISDGGYILYEKTLVRACYALSYLTFEVVVEVKSRTCERLVDLISQKSILIVGSALGVVGNIVRWGHHLQIQCLVKDGKLMQHLEHIVQHSQFEKFQMEGCRIISNIAARSEKGMDKSGLTRVLSNLLLATDKSDVKMEAAWAVFNMHYNVKCKHELIDNYEKDIVMSNGD